MNMYKFIKIRHDIISQCHGNYKEMKKFNYKLEIEIFRNSTQKYVGVPEGFFLRVWVSKKAHRPKTMKLSRMTVVDYHRLVLLHKSLIVVQV